MQQPQQNYQPLIWMVPQQQSLQNNYTVQGQNQQISHQKEELRPQLVHQGLTSNSEIFPNMYLQQQHTSENTIIKLPQVAQASQEPVKCSCTCYCSARLNNKQQTQNQEGVQKINEYNNINQARAKQEESSTISNTIDNQEQKYQREADQIRKRLNIADSLQIQIIEGRDITEDQLPRQRFIPKIRTFQWIKVFRQQNKRWLSHFLCQYENCDMMMKKWGNLFDHLRSHSHERPFRCPVNYCGKAFTQKSNLEKHMETHKKSLLRCVTCKNLVQKSKILRHQEQHYFDMEQYGEMDSNTPKIDQSEESD
ncbi:zinc finger protein zxdc [Stylonychia lemnae]|uniref:Zinc finger protein zxdc n=1 Tax=Stylonychia lemnae TaxID=5949 RepID=A0A078ADP2_STYLE|nr:zinc finger protein zxdc [Stylonychia lemnae]|eukprot:CDW79652.1 zinc finger protein zxdc [Stylonychia lemnae]